MNFNLPFEEEAYMVDSISPQPQTFCKERGSFKEANTMSVWFSNPLTADLNGFDTISHYTLFKDTSCLTAYLDWTSHVVAKVPGLEGTYSAIIDNPRSLIDAYKMIPRGKIIIIIIIAMPVNGWRLAQPLPKSHGLSSRHQRKKLSRHRPKAMNTKPSTTRKQWFETTKLSLGITIAQKVAG
ncbi:uncharacterized protein FFMR_08527 [Fusarium fujikuroi]|nr:uncharacterized protein FFE2_06205 [Fusarium fujikuroi]SCO46519.1 uncharacterized protein FFMR_08527 [Fusarium fujikuroi]SCV42462.1 uncharacterized protein FFFS_06588 [Fusarium fujikuroi]